MVLNLVIVIDAEVRRCVTSEIIPSRENIDDCFLFIFLIELCCWWLRSSIMYISSMTQSKREWTMDDVCGYKLYLAGNIYHKLLISKSRARMHVFSIAELAESTNFHWIISQLQQPKTQQIHRLFKLYG